MKNFAHRQHVPFTPARICCSTSSSRAGFRARIPAFHKFRRTGTAEIDTAFNFFSILFKERVEVSGDTQDLRGER